MPESVRSGGSERGPVDSSADDRCPRCGATSVNVHGLADCPECSWVGSIDRR